MKNKLDTKDFQTGISIKVVNLTVAKIKQMQFLPTIYLSQAKVLGMLVNVRKDHPRVMLLEYSEDYYLYDLNWMCGLTEFYYRKGKSTVKKTFDTEKECSHYWHIYTDMRNVALKNHLYI